MFIYMLIRCFLNDKYTKLIAFGKHMICKIIQHYAIK